MVSYSRALSSQMKPRRGLFEFPPLHAISAPLPSEQQRFYRIRSSRSSCRPSRWRVVGESWKIRLHALSMGPNLITVGLPATCARERHGQTLTWNIANQQRPPVVVQLIFHRLHHKPVFVLPDPLSSRFIYASKNARKAVTEPPQLPKRMKLRQSRRSLKHLHEY